MSVIVTFRVKADPKKLEELADAEAEHLRGISDRAREHGCIAHRFYGSEDGQIIVIDEWPDEQSFQSFFQQEESNIGPVMEKTGVQGEPEINFWRKLETHDEIGWGA